MNGSIEALEKKILDIEKFIEPLSEELVNLKGNLRKAQSLKWINDNNVTASDVELSRTEKVSFGNIYSFLEWLKDNSKKTHCEWRGLIYNIADLSKNGMVWDKLSDGRVEDL